MKKISATERKSFSLIISYTIGLIIRVIKNAIFKEGVDANDSIIHALKCIKAFIHKLEILLYNT